jgi:hypothetical protein
LWRSARCRVGTGGDRENGEWNGREEGKRSGGKVNRIELYGHVVKMNRRYNTKSKRKIVMMVGTTDWVW